MTKQYKLKKIRALLTEGFTAEELRRLCYDEPCFKPIHNELAQNTGKATIVDRLVEYADQKLSMEILLTWAKEHNPALYEKNQPYYDILINSITSGKVQKKSQRAKNDTSLLDNFFWPLVVTITGGIVVGIIILFIEYRITVGSSTPTLKPMLTPETTAISKKQINISTSTLTPTFTPSPTLTPIAWTPTSLPTWAPSPTPVPPPTWTPSPIPPLPPSPTPVPPPTWTPSPTPVPAPTWTPLPTQQVANTPSSPLSCSTPTFFQNIWLDHPQLGCPTNSLTSDFTFQTFEGGILAWQKSPNPSTIFAFFYDDRHWERQIDPGGPPEPSCSEAEQTGGLGPIFGFGKLWCENTNWRERLGMPTSRENDGKNNQIQKFENGTVLTIGAAGGFILYSNSFWESF